MALVSLVSRSCLLFCWVCSLLSPKPSSSLMYLELATEGDGVEFICQDLLLLQHSDIILLWAEYYTTGPGGECVKQASFFGGKAPLQQWIGYCKRPLASIICVYLDEIHSYVNAASKSRSIFTTPYLCRILMCVNLLSFFFVDDRLSRNRLSNINSFIWSLSHQSCFPSQWLF